MDTQFSNYSKIEGEGEYLVRWTVGHKFYFHNIDRSPWFDSSTTNNLLKIILKSDKIIYLYYRNRISVCKFVFMFPSRADETVKFIS